jgi:hypothetical protein
LWEGFAFFENWWYEDMITRLILMRKSKKFIYIAQPLYNYSLRASSMSHSEWNSSDIRAIDQLWLVKRIIEDSDKFELENTDEQYPLIGKYAFCTH